MVVYDYGKNDAQNLANTLQKLTRNETYSYIWNKTQNVWNLKMRANLCNFQLDKDSLSRAEQTWVNKWINQSIIKVLNVFTKKPRSLVQFSCSVMSNSLQPHGPQHTRPPCPSPTPGVYSNSCPLSQWCHSTISSSITTFSSHLQSFPASGSFQMSQLFTHYQRNATQKHNEVPLHASQDGCYPKVYKQ